MRIPGITYDTNEELVSSDGHTNAALIGTHGGGDGEWTGIPSTPKQKRQKAYTLHTTVKQSKIPGAGLGLVMRQPNEVADEGQVLVVEQVRIRMTMTMMNDEMTSGDDGYRRR